MKLSLGQKGEKGSNWKGGITGENKRIRNLIEYRLWREALFARDNWTCQECGYKGNDIEAHHIKMWTKNEHLTFEVWNGITLCKKCHDLTYGKEEKFEAIYLGRTLNDYMLNTER